MASVGLKVLLNALNNEASCAYQVPFALSVLQSTTLAAEDASLLSKWHARLSALLQSKNNHARWAGVCLVKATLERPSGGWESLISHGGSWTKLLLTLLEREKLPVIIERAICTLSAIFDMTHDKPSLTREITTPALPTFCTIMCNLLNKPHLASLRKLILHQMQHVLVAHPTTFRPFAGKLQTAALAGISGAIMEPELVQLSASCYASLHLCAPKNTAAEQWSVGFLATLGECHVVLDYLLQHIVEEKPILPHPRGLEMLPFSSDFVEGAPAALQRLQSLLQVIKAFLTQATKELVNIPVAHLVHFCNRILDLTPRSGMRASAPQSSQLVLMTMLPALHLSALSLTSVMIDVLGRHLTPHVASYYGGVVNALSSTHLTLQTQAIHVHSQILQQYGQIGEPTSVLQAVKVSLRILSSVARSEISIAGSTVKPPQARKRKHGGNEGADTYSNAAAFHTLPTTPRLLAACGCLQATFATTHGVLAPAMRQQIERIVLQILLADAILLPAEVMVALLLVVRSAIQHPAHNASSIIAHAAHVADRLTFSAHKVVQDAAMALSTILQDLVHPRMPAVRRRLLTDDAEDEDDEDEEAEAADDAQAQMGDELTFEQVADDSPVHIQEPVQKKAAFAVPDKMEPYVAIEASKNKQVMQTATASEPTPKAEPSQKAEPAQPYNLDDADDDDEEMPEICTDSDTDDEA
ncbi:rRNA processing/ribosome biogenesis-domain-containing protein [Protomyces lactucae-debilis]|uniref:Pre-rRNA-processing protein RIX1 n=1 Tax=Protomyces lactucae-debilis TaxID=2754530 RepID=A0A1Y2F7X8_PROLT|nr:rRNA processing/ribosome biogenesis-domain-containing protein [Protomyces lactucae-debilis]ORY80002.1 rRNA processing/ribosome biogenesis-domain-containing protein [Protomyces lactucae-debilis]